MVLELIKGANLALRFLLELCALVALAHLGLRDRQGSHREGRPQHQRPARGRGRVGRFRGAPGTR